MLFQENIFAFPDSPTSQTKSKVRKTTPYQNQTQIHNQQQQQQQIQQKQKKQSRVTRKTKEMNDKRKLKPLTDYIALL